jgi:RNA polymerase sigma-70 factor (ECF subfamily)
MNAETAEHQDFSKRSDEELVDLVFENKELYSLLVSRYETKLMRYIRRISGFSQDDTEDILQEAFINAYRNLRGFDTDRKFSSWIYRITHNQTISHARRQKTRQKYQIDGIDDELVSRLASDDDIARDMERSMEAEEVRDLLARLDARHRDILILHYLEEMSYSEVSDVLRIPVGTVGTRLMRAKKAFKKIAGK